MSTVMSPVQSNTITIDTRQYNTTYQSANTQVVWESEAFGLIILPGGWEFAAGYRLASTLLVQLKMSASGVLATTHLETTEEYGWGSMTGEAIMDLLSSLVEYMESLEDRQDRLGEPALLDLGRLHQLLERGG